MNFVKLPPKIKVKIAKEKNGCFFAELPKFGIFTEADSFLELVYNINDLIYSFFEIDKKDQGKFWYLPSPLVKQKSQVKYQSDSLSFNILTRPGVNFTHM